MNYLDRAYILKAPKLCSSSKESLELLKDDTGYIPESRLMNALRTAAIIIYSNNPELSVDDVLQNVFELLDPLVYRAGDTTYDPKSGAPIIKCKTHIVTSRCMARYDYFKAYILKDITEKFQEMSRQKMSAMFSETRDPDPVKFLESCAKLLPNVNPSYLGQTATSIRKYCENVLANFGVEGASHTATLLYLYSATGGTGKGTFMRRMEHWANSRGVSLAAQANINTKWASEAFATSFITTVNEFFPPKSQETECITLINNLVDNELYTSEKKNVQPTEVKSITSIIVGANFQPYDSNARRYGMVNFNDTSLLNISSEDRENYVVERTPEEWDSIIDDLFNSCPFGEKFDNFDQKNINPRYANQVNDVQRWLDLIDNAEDMTINQFINAVSNLENWNAETRKRYKLNMIPFLQMLMDRGYSVLKKRVNGTLEFSHFDWTVIGQIEVGEKSKGSVYDDISNPLKATAMAWADIMYKYASGERDIEYDENCLNMYDETIKKLFAKKED